MGSFDFRRSTPILVAARRGHTTSCRLVAIFVPLLLDGNAEGHEDGARCRLRDGLPAHRAAGAGIRRTCGIDPWSAALTRARKRACRETANVTARGSAAAMPFAAATFDLIVSNLGLNSFDDVERLTVPPRGSQARPQLHDQPAGPCAVLRDPEAPAAAGDRRAVVTAMSAAPRWPASANFGRAAASRWRGWSGERAACVSPAAPLF